MLLLRLHYHRLRLYNNVLARLIVGNHVRRANRVQRELLFDRHLAIAKRIRVERVRYAAGHKNYASGRGPRPRMLLTFRGNVSANRRLPSPSQVACASVHTPTDG